MDSYKNYVSKGRAAHDAGDNATAKSYMLKALNILDDMSKDAYGPEQKARYHEMGQEILAFIRNKCNGAAVPVGGGQSKSSQATVATVIGEYNLCFLQPADNDMSFDKIIGAEDAKAKLRRFVLDPIKDPEPYKRKKLKIDCTALLWGSPGTGKSSFAMAAAKEARLPLVVVKISELVDKYVGETAKHISALFQELRRYVKENKTPVIVCFDEIDEITKQRDGDDKGSNSALPQLLREMQGIGNNNEGLVIIATTNVKGSIDEGVLSRFRQKIEIPLPDVKGLEGLFALMLDGLTKDEIELLDYKKLAKMSLGLSGRDIRHITDEFRLLTVERDRGVTKIDDLQGALEELVDTKKIENGLAVKIDKDGDIKTDMLHFCGDITKTLCLGDFETALDLVNELKSYITSLTTQDDEEDYDND